LIDLSKEIQLVKGISDVKNHLSKLHHGLRNRSVQHSNDEYLLKINLPILRVNPSDSLCPTPFLVDTPGSSEVGEKQLQNIAEANLQYGAAFIFVMKYDDLKNKEDYAALAALKDRDPEIFESERLTIVITHYDASFQNKENYIHIADLKRNVATSISNHLKVPVSEGIIYPICGKWASDVRTCQKEGRLRDDVVMSLVSVKMTKESQGSCMDVMKSVQKMPDNEVLRAMETISMIKTLEERIETVSSRLSIIWKKNMVSSCKAFLNSAIKMINFVEQSFDNEIKGNYLID
jgi:hypothetical protein